jgi:hypothetical protein
MNTYQHFKLRLEPRKELALLCQIAAGLAASGHFTYAPETLPKRDPADALDVLRTYALETPGPDGTMRITGAVLLTDTAREILSRLRRDVEEHVEDSPEMYRDLAADQLPAE